MLLQVNPFPMLTLSVSSARVPSPHVLCKPQLCGLYRRQLTLPLTLQFLPARPLRWRLPSSSMMPPLRFLHRNRMLSQELFWSLVFYVFPRMPVCPWVSSLILLILLLMTSSPYWRMCALAVILPNLIGLSVLLRRLGFGPRSSSLIPLRLRWSPMPPYPPQSSALSPFHDRSARRFCTLSGLSCTRSSVMLPLQPAQLPCTANYSSSCLFCPLMLLPQIQRLDVLSWDGRPPFGKTRISYVSGLRVPRTGTPSLTGMHTTLTTVLFLVASMGCISSPPVFLAKRNPSQPRAQSLVPHLLARSHQLMAPPLSRRQRSPPLPSSKPTNLVLLRTPISKPWLPCWMSKAFLTRPLRPLLSNVISLMPLMTLRLLPQKRKAFLSLTKSTISPLMTEPRHPRFIRDRLSARLVQGSLTR